MTHLYWDSPITHIHPKWPNSGQIQAKFRSFQLNQGWIFGLHANPAPSLCAWAYAWPVSILRYTKHQRNATEYFCVTLFWNSVTQKICVTRRRILPSRCFKIALRQKNWRNAISKQRYAEIFCRNAVLKQRYDKKSSALNKSGRWENNLGWENI